MSTNNNNNNKLQTCTISAFEDLLFGDGSSDGSSVKSALGELDLFRDYQCIYFPRIRSAYHSITFLQIKIEYCIDMQQVLNAMRFSCV